MSGILRYVGIANAAIWFGAGIFFTFGIGPGVFSQEVHDLFGEAAFRFYAGGVALILVKRYFLLQYLCGALALLHLGAERFYSGRKVSRAMLLLLLAMFGLALLGGRWLQPRMENLRLSMYHAPSPQEKDAARRSFDLWHGVSESGNLLLLAGAAAYLARIVRPPEARRFGTFTQIRS